MPRPGSGSMGHRRHYLMGKPLRTGRSKMALTRDANQPNTRPKPVMVPSIQDLFKKR